MWTRARVLSVGGGTLFMMVGIATAYLGWDLLFPPAPPAPVEASKILVDVGTVNGGAWTWVSSDPKEFAASSAGDIELTLTVSSTTPEGSVAYLQGPIAEQANCYPVREETVAFDQLPAHVVDALVKSYVRPADHGAQSRYEGFRSMSDDDALAAVKAGSLVAVRFLEFRKESAPRSIRNGDVHQEYSPSFASTACTVSSDAVWSSEKGRRTLTLPTQISTGEPASDQNHLAASTGIAIFKPAELIVPWTTKTLDYNQEGVVRLNESWSVFDKQERATVVLSSTSIAFQDAEYQGNREALAFWVSLGLAVTGTLFVGLLKLGFDGIFPTRDGGTRG